MNYVDTGPAQGTTVHIIYDLESGLVLHWTYQEPVTAQFVTYNLYSLS